MDKDLIHVLEKIANTLEEKRPAAFLLENVRNLCAHDKGRTFDTIRVILNDLGKFSQAKLALLEAIRLQDNFADAFCCLLTSPGTVEACYSSCKAPGSYAGKALGS